MFPDVPDPKATGKYYLEGWGECYYVSQEMDDNSWKKSSPCLKSQEDATKLLKEIRGDQ